MLPSLGGSRLEARRPVRGGQEARAAAATPQVRTPAARSRSISPGEYPKRSWSTESVSAPRSGAGFRTFVGVPDIVHGMPAWMRRPTSGCSSSTRKPRSRRCAFFGEIPVAHRRERRHARPAAASRVVSQRSRALVHFVMISSRAASFCLRSAVVRNRGSSARPGCPIAPHSARHSSSLPTGCRPTSRRRRAPCTCCAAPSADRDCRCARAHGRLMRTPSAPRPSSSAPPPTARLIDVLAFARSVAVEQRRHDDVGAPNTRVRDRRTRCRSRPAAAGVARGRRSPRSAPAGGP